MRDSFPTKTSKKKTKKSQLVWFFLNSLWEIKKQFSLFFLFSMTASVKHTSMIPKVYVNGSETFSYLIVRENVAVVAADVFVNYSFM